MNNIGARWMARSLLGLFWGGLCVSLMGLKSTLFFPILDIHFQDFYPATVSDEVNRKMVQWQEKNLLDIRLAEVSQELRQIPWIKAVDVRRVWPNQLDIRLQSQTAQARWGTEGGVISTEGEIFYPEKTSIPKGLPLFLASSEDSQEILRIHREALVWFTPLNLSIKEIKLTSMEDLEIRLDNEIAIILGKEAVGESLSKFAAVFGEHFKTLRERIRYVDLRYATGVAVGWKS